MSRCSLSGAKRAPKITVTSRRSLLQLGFSGAAAALAAGRSARGSGPPQGKNTACIVFFLDGGHSHHETFDPKPDAPKEVRGEFGVTQTSVAGTHISDQLPRLGKLAEHYSLVRSLHHGNPSHAEAEHQMLTGWMGSRPGTARAVIEKPSLGSIVSRLAGARRSALPSYVAVPWSFHHEYGGSPFGAAAYLGPRHEPLESGHLPKTADQPFELQEIKLRQGLSPGRLHGRVELLEQLNANHLASEDVRRIKDTADEAFDILLADQVRDAFNLNREPTRVRERYGNHEWGQAALLSRRLVEAGTTFVMLQCGLRQDWDTHQKNFPLLKKKLLPPLDHAVSALLEDLLATGLYERTLVIVMGEFGRTPVINKNAGRDHWAEVFSALVAGGGLKGGQVIGASDRQGAYPSDRPLHAQDLFATMYHVLGIDPGTLLYDRQSRPIPVLSHGTPIRELV